MAALFAILYRHYVPLHSVFWLKTQAISSKKHQGIPTVVMATSGGNGANISTTLSALVALITMPTSMPTVTLMHYLFHAHYPVC